MTASQRRDAVLACPVVLIVENDIELCDAIRTRLEHEGCFVITAGDGVEALWAIERMQPDIVMLELDLPVMSGIRLLRLIRRDPAFTRLPVIVITTYSFEQVRDVVELGVLSVFEKPFCIEDLVEAVRSYLYGFHGWAGAYLTVA